MMGKAYSIRILRGKRSCYDQRLVEELWKVSKREYCIPKMTVTAIPTP